MKYNKETRIGIKQLEAKANALLKNWNVPKKERKKREYKKRIPKKYALYIKSKFWTKRKNDYYRVHKKICQACSSKKFINLHHILYEDFGFEKDENLVALCRDCHEEFHEMYGVKHKMKKETNQFIIEKRELIDFPTL